MKIKIWEAFASNNSGSYTIIGSFESRERAAEVAAAIRTVAAKHAAWLASMEGKDLDDEASPLAAFAREHRLSWTPGCGTWGEWPEYDDHNVPDVTAFGDQVLVHVHYTASMPPTFGEFFYKRGGRVATEIDHAHTSIVVKVTAWWSYQNRDQKKVDRSIEAVIEELPRNNGLFARLPSSDHPYVAFVHEGIEGDLKITCILEDLCAGCREITETIARHGGQSFVQVSELEH